MNAVLKRLGKTTHLYGANAPYLEAYYESYLQDPQSIPRHWKDFFDRMHAGSDDVDPVPAQREGSRADASLDADAAEKQAAVLQLINAYRVRGHQNADIDPLYLDDRPAVVDLDPTYHGLTSTDLDRVFNAGSLAGIERAPLREIHDLVCRVYCGTIGAEYMHITDTRQKRWIQQALEGARGRLEQTPEIRRRILERISAAEGLERYLHTRYLGQKRFSLEGGESLIPLLDDLILRAGTQGVKEIVIGMTHRGRLNVLVNTLGKQPCDLFQEFEGGTLTNDRHTGDVKYHQGFSADTATPGGPVHVALAFNPSHLEIIGPVVEGSVRARQHRRRDLEGVQVLPVLIHGDSAFAGQGVVMENFNMSQARGFTTGGTVHIVVNNQIGFTTSNPLDMRSTLYCTDVAKMVQAPIFHVNGDDPEAVVAVASMALDYRMTFHKDVVIDMVCYRRHGHNEADEPAATQPVMYHKVRNHPTLLQLYSQKLQRDGVVSAGYVEELQENYRQSLDQCSIVSPHSIEGASHAFQVEWKPYIGTQWTDAVVTAAPLARLQDLALRQLELPEGIELHPRVNNIMNDRRKMAAGALPLDWGFAETLAYASLLDEGFPIRLSGQDSGRGTFFHRHAVLHNQGDGAIYVPLQHLGDGQANFIVIDSLLSEEAVLAFEYGFATAEPGALVIWEAQFGDFANGAQVVIDQFISSGELKWGRLCGLVMFLPHGYEGQGAEHSSARLERYLQLCAEQNIQVCVPTTPAQMFHLLRRQMLRPYRKPLVVLTPKSLLRHRLSVSTLDDLADGEFQLVIPDHDVVKKEAVQRVVLCTGKVYYDLMQTRADLTGEDVAVLRIEQLYPFPRDVLTAELHGYKNAVDVVWCQEEPRNQGCWYQIRHHLHACLATGQSLRYAGRAPSAAPATGHFNVHIERQRQVVEAALLGAPK